MDVAWRATHVCSFCFRMHLDQIRPKQLVKLFIFELMNLIHNHWGKSFEARNREIFLPRLTAGKIIRNQDEQGQLSWPAQLGLVFLLPELLQSFAYSSIGFPATAIPMRFTLLVPGWIGVPVTRWMFLGFIQRGTPTSQMLRLLINLSMLLQISFVRITSRDFPLSFSMSCSSQERERASASFLILILYFLAESCSQGLDPMVNIKPLASGRSASDLVGRLETGFIREDLKRFERPMR